MSRVWNCIRLLRSVGSSIVGLKHIRSGICLSKKDATGADYTDMPE